jgi:hypothetical protein
MLHKTSGLRVVGGLTVALGLLLMSSAMACNSGPTEPTFDELVGIYTGRWRGNISGSEVVLEVRAERGRPQDGGLVGLSGTASALNSSTGESHGLTILGQAVGSSTTFFWLVTSLDVGPGGVILGGGKNTGQFEGAVSGDRRTWPGRWTTHIDGASIFGPGEHSVTLIKE